MPIRVLKTAPTTRSARAKNSSTISVLFLSKKLFLFTYFYTFHIPVNAVEKLIVADALIIKAS